MAGSKQGTPLSRVYMIGDPVDFYYWLQGTPGEIASAAERALSLGDLFVRFVNHTEMSIHIQVGHIKAIVPEALTLEELTAILAAGPQT